MRLFVICFFCLVSTAHAEPKLARVIDGDTVVITENGENYHLRLLDIDAPEINQAYGKKAKRALNQLCKSASVQIDSGQIASTNFDRYGRRLGRLYCNQQDASAYLLQQGLAWFNRPYAHRQDYQMLESEAQEAQLGLWHSQDPTPPWTWRHSHANQYGR